MEKRCLRIGFVSDFALMKTGFGRSQKELLSYFYSTKKYEIFNLCQGMSDNNPDFQRVPWKCFGAINNFDNNKFQTDPNYQRWVAYGNAAITNFVISNQLDVIVHQQDIWSSSIEAYLKQDWFQNIKHNFIQSSTADSLPILPDFKEWAKSGCQMWFWSSFAERALKKENLELYKDCKTVHGPVNCKDFYPLPKYEKQELRKRFGILEDEKICIYLGRNQLRKSSFWANMEGLVEFRKNNPNKKLRLLYHCSWSEGAGWPLERIRNELGLKKDDVLTTYYCRNCHNWNIQPYEGEDLNCVHCNTVKSRITAGIGSTISENDLNKIYNIADFSCAVATSAGIELTNIECLLAGIPLATAAYSGMEEFTPNDFVYTITGNFYRECGTGFYKFTPNIYSIAKFYEYMFKIDENKRKDYIKRGREWAIEQFDTKNIVKVYEQFFDSCKPIDWKPYLERKKELKNPNAQVQDSQDDIEFVKNCYRDILNCPDVEKSDNNGYNHWLNFLKQPIDKSKLKNDMVLCFKNAALEHNRKNNPVPFDIELIKNNKKHLLIVLSQSIGDIILSTSLLKSFRQNYPSDYWNIYYATKPEYHCILEGNKNIDKILSYQDFMEQEIICTGAGKHIKGYFDAYVHLGNSQQHKLNYLTNSNICLPQCRIREFKFIPQKNDGTLNDGLLLVGLEDN